MAIYHCSMKPVSRSTGRSSVAAAAYRSGERLVNASDGQVHDYRGKAGIEHVEILAPAGVGAAWAMDRSALWNAVERAEKRKDARVAREFEVALPHELTPEQRVELTRAFAQDLANRYGAAVDFALHSPSGETDIRNHHAHILMTTREVTAKGLGEKTRMEWRNARLLAEGLPTSHMQLRDLRQAWEHHANEHLARAGRHERIDHRSHEDRGLEILPTSHMGVHATEMQRRGMDVERVRLEREAAEHNAAFIQENPARVFDLILNEKSVFDRHDVARALHRAIDDPAEFQNAFARVMASGELVELRGDVRDGRGHVAELARYSTRDMIALEAGMVECAGRMADEGGHGVDWQHVEQVFASRDWLSEEQRAAVCHITGDERAAAVIGLAGAGKSTMLASAREAWEAQGYRVHGAALAGKAAEGLETSSGIRSRTLASWEYGWANGRDQLGPRDVFVIDEAGMVSSRQMARFVEEVDRAGAKLVLVGDPEQLQPIQAGAAFRAVTERIGFAELEEVHRQHEPWQREASHEFARLRVEKGLAVYEAHGAIRFAETREDARTAIVAEVMRDREAQPDASQLVLTYRRADVRALNEAIRAERGERGELGGEQLYRTNDGERAFAPGDRVLFLENDRELGVKNGMLGTVTAVEPGLVHTRLDGASRDPGQDRVVTIPADRYQSFDHGYATTIHKSQGATVDRTYVLASGGMDSHLAYVAMTRHRDAVQLHAGRDDFADMKTLSITLGQARSKETTLDYAERRGIAVEASQVEIQHRDARHHGNPQPIRVPDVGGREAPIGGERRSLADQAAGRIEGTPEPERLSIGARIAALVARVRGEPEQRVEDRAMPASERGEVSGQNRARTSDGSGGRAGADQRPNASWEHAIGRADSRGDDDKGARSISERLEALHDRQEGREERASSKEHERGSDGEQKRSIAERLAELREREVTPEERQRSREQERERDRGGHER